jgi:hypothetical protein
VNIAYAKRKIHEMNRHANVVITGRAILRL